MEFYSAFYGCRFAARDIARGRRRLAGWLHDIYYTQTSRHLYYQIRFRFDAGHG